MKLIIQIPAYNEEQTIEQTLGDLPKRIPGITSIQTLVIDDGSLDGTAAAAERAGAHVVRLMTHRGLSAAFLTGLESALRLGADIIVNTDADHQYRGQDVARLIAPIVDGSAEVVIGDRNVRTNPHMSGLKRVLQRLGSWAVGLASGMTVTDVTSGFRAFSREAALRINVFNPFTYTLETIIQAGTRNLTLRSVPVETNPPTRPSRLYRGVLTYLRKSIVTIFRIHTLYRPLKTFFFFGVLFLIAGAALGVRFLYFFITEASAGHVQSLILAAVLLIFGFQTILFGLLADLISVNRRLHEETLIRLRRLELEGPRRQGRNRSRAIDAPDPSEPEPAQEEPENQWVWLVEDEPGSQPADPSAGRRRRRKRRGGPHRVAEPRDRKHQPRLQEPDPDRPVTDD